MKCLQMALLSATTASLPYPNSTKLPLRSSVGFFSLSIPSQTPFELLSRSSPALRLSRCRAAAPDPPPPPGTDPPPADLAASLSKLQDRLQIFFAVLFWMSLFFWASAWDGRNRPNKGSRFRR